MQMKKFGLLTLLALSFCALAHAEWTISNGKLIDKKKAATLTVQDHFGTGMGAMEHGDWQEAATQFTIISNSFPNTSYGQDASYYLGVSYFHLKELDFANDAFTQYLKSKNNPQFFQEAIEYKFQIAEAFKGGSKKRVMGYKQLPKWSNADNLCVQIYDEVIAAMPCHDIAARALYSKAGFLWKNGQYRESIDAYQTLIKRFSKHELAPESFLCINKVYLDQCQNEYQNPDILAFSQINLRRFKQEFPREERIHIAEEDCMRIKEVYAKGLYETGQFYERTHHPHASIIYYTNAIMQFPDTQVANLCRERLVSLKADILPTKNDS